MSAILMMACGHNSAPLYQQIASEGWQQNKKVVFPAPEDREAWQQIFVRVNQEYPYTNLCIELRHDSLVDTLAIPVGIHDKDKTAYLPEEISAPLLRPISGRVSIRPLMTDEILTGILSIGLE